MKKLAFLLVALFIATASYSQQLISGPKAKNAQIGKVRTPKITMLHDSNPSTLKGPIAKNSEVWMEEPARKFKVGFRDEINNPQGLKAKNSNPWDKPEPKVDSKAVYQEPKSMTSKKTWIH
jgi:hypothetical protein